MSKEVEITKAAMFVEVDGKLYTVNLPQDEMILLCKMASAAFSDSGALPLVKLPEGFEFTTIGELQA